MSDSTHVCPDCRAVLERVQLAQGAIYRCARCGGGGITAEVLRQHVGAHTVREVLAQAQRGPVSGRACPFCGRGLRVARVVRDAREARAARVPGDPRDARDLRDRRDARDPRDARDLRDARDPRDARKARDEGVGNDRSDPHLARGERIGPDTHEVDIDVCSRCPAVWLDAGERERLPTTATAPPGPASPGSFVTSLSGEERARAAQLLLDQLERSRPLEPIAPSRPQDLRNVALGRRRVPFPEGRWGWVLRALLLLAPLLGSCRTLRRHGIGWWAVEIGITAAIVLLVLAWTRRLSTTTRSSST